MTTPRAASTDKATILRMKLLFQEAEDAIVRAAASGCTDRMAINRATRKLVEAAFLQAGVVMRQQMPWAGARERERLDGVAENAAGSVMANPEFWGSALVHKFNPDVERGGASLRTYFNTVIRNKIVDHLRREPGNRSRKKPAPGAQHVAAAPTAVSMVLTAQTGDTTANCQTATNQASNTPPHLQGSVAIMFDTSMPREPSIGPDHDAMLFVNRDASRLVGNPLTFAVLLSAEYSTKREERVAYLRECGYFQGLSDKQALKAYDNEQTRGKDLLAAHLGIARPKHASRPAKDSHPNGIETGNAP
jgi:hypothetical protein